MICLGCQQNVKQLEDHAYCYHLTNSSLKTYQRYQEDSVTHYESIVARHGAPTFAKTPIQVQKFYEEVTLNYDLLEGMNE